MTKAVKIVSVLVVLFKSLPLVFVGSAYCDGTIRSHGFNGERVTSGAVLGVKTHYNRKVIWTDLDKPVLETMNREFKYLVYFAIYCRQWCYWWLWSFFLYSQRLLHHLEW